MCIRRTVCPKINRSDSTKILKVVICACTSRKKKVWLTLSLLQWLRGLRNQYYRSTTDHLFASNEGLNLTCVRHQYEDALSPSPWPKRSPSFSACIWGSGFVLEASIAPHWWEHYKTTRCQGVLQLLKKPAVSYLKLCGRYTSFFLNIFISIDTLWEYLYLIDIDILMPRNRYSLQYWATNSKCNN